MAAMIEVQPPLARANVHVRRELGLPVNEEDYLAHVQADAYAPLARFREVMDQLESELGEWES